MSNNELYEQIKNSLYQIHNQLVGGDALTNRDYYEMANEFLKVEELLTKFFECTEERRKIDFTPIYDIILPTLMAIVAMPFATLTSLLILYFSWEKYNEAWEFIISKKTAPSPLNQRKLELYRLYSLKKELFGLKLLRNNNAKDFSLLSEEEKASLSNKAYTMYLATVIALQEMNLENDSSTHLSRRQSNIPLK